MSNYTKATNFASKDALTTGNPLKTLSGTELDDEFNNIATAVATKANSSNTALTGTPTAPTATAGTNSTQVATTAFVTTVDVLKAPLASPTLTGTPTAPTAAADTSTTQLATTAFVTTEANLKADLASPTFTGVPVAPTAAADTSTTQVATTAFVTTEANLKADLAGAAFTGAITTTSTIDGVDIAARDAILSSTTVTADAALPKAGGTMTGIIAGFDSTGIADNATATKLTVSDTGIDVTGTAVADALGVGTSSPAKDFAILSTNSTGSAQVKLSLSTSTPSTYLGQYGAGTYLSNNTTYQSGWAADDVTKGVALVRLASAGDIALSNAVAGLSAPVERMRIGVDATVYVGKIADDFGVAGHQLFGAGEAYHTKSESHALALNRLVSVGDIAKFHKDGAAVGSISVTGSATAYNTSSDYRLKTDVQPMTGATATFMQLKPVNFEWISSGERVDGFLAHELQEVIPSAAHGTKDAVDEDGVAVMQGIDQSKVVPLLTAALQEAIATIAAMEVRLAALEV